MKFLEDLLGSVVNKGIFCGSVGKMEKKLETITSEQSVYTYIYICIYRIPFLIPHKLAAVRGAERNARRWRRL